MSAPTRPTGAVPYRALAQRIKAARAGMRLSQREIAPAAEISGSYWGNLEAGIVRPRPDTLHRIALALAVDAEELADLAGYRDAPWGYTLISVPPEKAAIVRWFAALPMDQQDRARRLLEDAPADGPPNGEYR
jgi:transcriptional regulator with XRE-family HTH domain